MNLKLQTAFVFIPILNITVAVFWLISCIKRKKFSTSMVVLPIVAIGACLIGAMIRTIVDILGVSETAYTIITYSTLYLQCVVGPFCMLIDEIKKNKQDNQKQKS